MPFPPRRAERSSRAPLSNSYFARTPDDQARIRHRRVIAAIASPNLASHAPPRAAPIRMEACFAPLPGIGRPPSPSRWAPLAGNRLSQRRPEPLPQRHQRPTRSHGTDTPPPRPKRRHAPHRPSPAQIRPGASPGETPPPRRRRRQRLEAWDLGLKRGRPSTPKQPLPSTASWHVLCVSGLAYVHACARARPYSPSQRARAPMRPGLLRHRGPRTRRRAISHRARHPPLRPHARAPNPSRAISNPPRARDAAAGRRSDPRARGSTAIFHDGALNHR